MAELLGTLQQLAGFSTHARILAVYDNAFVLARGSDAAAIGRLVGGSLGASAGKRRAKSKDAAAAGSVDPDQLASAHKENELIPFEAIANARLERTKMRLYRQLSLTLRNGTTKTFKWQPGHNKDKATVPMLKRALGDRLATF